MHTKNVSVSDLHPVIARQPLIFIQTEQPVTYNQFQILVMYCLLLCKLHRVSKEFYHLTRPLLLTLTWYSTMTSLRACASSQTAFVSASFLWYPTSLDRLEMANNSSLIPSRALGWGQHNCSFARDGRYLLKQDCTLLELIATTNTIHHHSKSIQPCKDRLDFSSYLWKFLLAHQYVPKTQGVTLPH